MLTILSGITSLCLTPVLVFLYPLKTLIEQNHDETKERKDIG